MFIVKILRINSGDFFLSFFNKRFLKKCYFCFKLETMKNLLSTLFLILILSNSSIVAQDSNSQLHFEKKKKGYRLYNNEQLVSKTIYIKHSVFSEDLCAVMNKEREWGFINKEGTLAIPFEFREASDFKDGVSLVTKDGYSSYINKKGKIVKTAGYTHINKYINGIAIAFLKNIDTSRYGNFVYVYSLIDRAGNDISDNYYTAIKRINDTVFQGIIYNTEYRIYADGSKDSIGEIAYSKSLHAIDSFDRSESASFEGGDMKRQHFIRNNIHYPQKAKETGQQGTVYIKFVIEKDGTVIYPNILRGVCPSIDSECFKLINSMPKWKPSKRGGKVIRSDFIMPLKFVLAG